jgi:hypothetical protein
MVLAVCVGQGVTLGYQDIMGMEPLQLKLGG